MCKPKGYLIQVMDETHYFFFFFQIQIIITSTNKVKCLILIEKKKRVFFWIRSDNETKSVIYQKTTWTLMQYYLRNTLFHRNISKKKKK